MLLTIDAGNTNITFAIYAGERLRAQWRLGSGIHRTADEMAIWLSQLMGMQGIKAADIDGAILSCVIPYALHDLKQLSKRYFNTEMLVIGEGSLAEPIAVALDKGTQVGADRLVNAFAAWQQYKQPCIIVDFGTATTFDVVSAQGAYAGGVIAPGVHLSLHALEEAAAKLPTIDIKAPQSVIGKNTTHAMQSGMYWGYVSLIEGIITRIKQETGETMKVIATGGLAALYAKDITLFDAVDADLTIRGLQEIYDGYA